MFDDVHWAEPTFLDLVEYLGERLGTASVLLLCLARPQLAEHRPAWLQPPAESLVVDRLHPLDQQGRFAKACRGAHQGDLATQPGVQALNKTGARNHVITTAW